MSDDRGDPVFAGPTDVWMHVKIAAPDASPERLRALVEAGDRCSPIPNAVRNVTPLTLRIDVEVDA